MNESNLNRAGRKPIFTRLEAFKMLENRRLYGAELRITASAFIDLMVSEGELTKPCSVPSMQRLLNGSMFPDLHTFTAEGQETETPYDYSTLPKCEPGQPPKAERLNPDGSLKGKFSKLSKQLLDEIDRRVEARAATIAEQVVQSWLQGVNQRLTDLEERRPIAR